MGDTPVLARFNKLVRDPFGGYADFYSREQRIRLEQVFDREKSWNTNKKDPVIDKINK